MKHSIDPALKKHYADLIEKHGGGAEGVGWKNEEAQQVRFDQLAKLLPKNNHFTVNDLGCGTGGFYQYLNDRSFKFEYYGYDVLKDMIDLCNANKAVSNAKFYHIGSVTEIAVADFSIASGIFNIKYELPDDYWKSYIIDTLKELNRKSRLGFAFNALTSYSDKEHMKKELFYSNPLELFDFCKTQLAANVALLHDYFQFDFTLIVRKNK